MIYIEKELDDLKKEVLEMWDLVNSQLNRAGEALLSMDKELAHEVTSVSYTHLTLPTNREV